MSRDVAVLRGVVVARGQAWRQWGLGAHRVSVWGQRGDRMGGGSSLLLPPPSSPLLPLLPTDRQMVPGCRPIVHVLTLTCPPHRMRTLCHQPVSLCSPLFWVLILQVRSCRTTISNPQPCEVGTTAPRNQDFAWYEPKSEPKVPAPAATPCPLLGSPPLTLPPSSWLPRAPAPAEKGGSP